jgi:hypothetical protein
MSAFDLQFVLKKIKDFKCGRQMTTYSLVLQAPYLKINYFYNNNRADN